MSVTGISSSSSSLDIEAMAKKMFQKLDTNEDGGLDAEELAALSQDGKGPSADEILSKFDSDGDGILSESENLTAMQSAPRPPQGDTSADGKSDMFAKLLEKFDKDGDGSLSSEELDEMTADGKGPSTEELLAKFDSDGDGKISASENEEIEKTMPPPPPPPQNADEEDSNSLLSQLDTNGDGTISKAELTAATASDSGIESLLSILNEKDSDSDDEVDSIYSALQQQMKVSTSYSADGTASSNADSLLDIQA